jgi:hypothetical protein
MKLAGSSRIEIGARSEDGFGCAEEQAMDLIWECLYLGWTAATETTGQALMGPT